MISTSFVKWLETIVDMIRIVKISVGSEVNREIMVIEDVHIMEDPRDKTWDLSISVDGWTIKEYR